MSLYPLAHLLHEFQRIEEQLIENEGELSPLLEEKLLNLEVSMPEKIDAYNFLIEKLAHDALYWKEKYQKYQALSKAYEKSSSKLKNALKSLMIQKNLNQLDGFENRFKLCEAKKSLELYEAIIPEEYWRTEITKVLDKDKILSHLNQGRSIPGAQLIDNKSLRSYPQKKNPLLHSTTMVVERLGRLTEPLLSTGLSE